MDNHRGSKFALVEKTITEMNFVEGVLCQEEIQQHQNNATFIHKLCEDYRWSMVSLSYYRQSAFSSVSTNRKFAALTKSGVIVTVNGVYANLESFKMTLPPEFSDAPLINFCIAESGWPASYDDAMEALDAQIVVSKIFYATIGKNTAELFTTIKDVKYVTAAGRKIPIADEKNKVFCGWCNTFYPYSTANEIMGMALICHKCGKQSSDDEHLAAIKESNIELLTDDAAVLSQVWYHASSRANWSDLAHMTGDKPVVHLGSLAAALERGDYYAGEYVYEVRLKSGTPVSSAIATDNNAAQPKTVAAMTAVKTMVGNGANRYINAYEDCGSVSLMVDPDSFEIIRRMTNKEARAKL